MNVFQVMPAKRKVAKRKTKVTVETAPALPVSEDFVCSVKDDGKLLSQFAG